MEAVAALCCPEDPEGAEERHEFIHVGAVVLQSVTTLLNPPQRSFFLMMLKDSPCSDTELCINRLSLLCTAAASDALGPPLPIELDVLLLLWRKTVAESLVTYSRTFKLLLNKEFG